jgi:phosphonate transport system ATP-binding protein
MLRIEHLTKVYENGVRALDDVSVTIGEGEFVVVVGLSGAGKSTLLRCLNRLVEPTAGKVYIDGLEVTAAGPQELRAVRLKIGMIFQQFNLIRRWSVLRNVLAGRLGYVSTLDSLLGRFPPADYERAWRNLARVGLLDKAFQRADTLSGGQQQRVAIARALMQEPRIILADEPVSNLDPVTAHSVLRYLEEINREDGITIIANLHLLSLARRYATRVLGLRAGRLVFDGPPAAVDQQRFREIYGDEAEDLEIA